MTEVSVILPSLNEEKSIGICIGKIKKVFKEHGINGEIIVSDNSTDKTPDIARSLGAKVVTPDRKGYGYAYLFAFKYAKGKYIVIGDADNTYDFLEIPKLLEPLRKGEADIIIGSRFKGEIKKGAMPWLHKYIGNPLLTWFLNVFFKAGVSDAHCGFRALTREALEKMQLRSHGMEFASEMIIEAIRKGLKIKEVPITYHPRQGESKLSSFRDGWRHLKFMLLHTPKHLFIYPGLLLIVVGFLLMVSGLLKIYIGYLPGLHSLIAASLLIVSGYQVIFFGLFASIREGKKLPKLFTLERGAAIGAALLIAGFIYALSLILKWVASGFKSLPPSEHSILAFTIIVIGIETFFSSFMLSMMAELGKT